MIWYFMFMLSGAAFVALGMWLGIQAQNLVPQRADESEKEASDAEGKVPTRVMRQWENLLNYDGTVQEDDLDEN